MKVELRFEPYIGEPLIVELQGPQEFVEPIVRTIRRMMKDQKYDGWNVKET